MEGLEIAKIESMMLCLVMSSASVISVMAASLLMDKVDNFESTATSMLSH